MRKLNDQKHQISIGEFERLRIQNTVNLAREKEYSDHGLEFPPRQNSGPWSELTRSKMVMGVVPEIGESQSEIISEAPFLDFLGPLGFFYF